MIQRVIQRVFATTLGVAILAAPGVYLAQKETPRSGVAAQSSATSVTLPGSDNPGRTTAPDKLALALAEPEAPVAATILASNTAAPTTSTNVPGNLTAAPESASSATTTTTTPTSTTTTTTVAATASTTATTAPTAANSGDALRLWDTAWQVATKADDSAMQTYVHRLAAARGSAGQNVTGFWFSVVNLTSDINTPNGFGHSFGSFAEPNADYLADIARLISLASSQGLKVGIVVAWDGPNQFSVESGRLNANNGHQYGYALASYLTGPDSEGRNAIDSWIMGGDTTNDCCNGEHGAVWAEVVRGLEDGQAANGFSARQILFHTAPGQHMNYLGASWLDGHAPQTGHCTSREQAVQWMLDLANTGAAIWGNGEMRYEDISWSCNGNVAITPEQVLADTIAMKNLGVMNNFVYGFDPRWNSANPGSVGMSSSGVSAGLQLILDEPGLIRPR